MKEADEDIKQGRVSPYKFDESNDKPTSFEATEKGNTNIGTSESGSQLHLSDSICNDEFDIMPHKFKCQKEIDHPIGYHYYMKDDWDEASVIIFWRHK